MIPRETIDKVFSAAKIEEVVSDYVTLKKRGANLIGLCPFHTEKTGSFTVSPSKGIYKCFGCGKSGHAIGFVMEIEQCGFADAVKQVAKKYHIPIEEREMTAEEQQRQDDRESMFVVNDFANKWFQQQLWDTPEGKAIGLSYFRERGLREDTIRKFQLGYSPEKGNPLSKALQKQGFLEKYLVNNVDNGIGTGVCGKSEDGRIYDRFRDRVIFPIFSVSGKPVGFAGRILKKKDNAGKYVNSPDSIVYSKTRELYGLFQAKQTIAREDLCYLVEGQMDVISMHQAGIENVVASGGTALTKPQIQLIHRFTNNIIVLYDGDAAGIHAALRGIDMFLEEGFNVRVVLLPDGEDPDSFAQSHNASDFIEYIKAHQTDFIRFKSALLYQEAGEDPIKKSALVKDIVTSIAQIPDIITRQIYIRDCADRLGLREQILAREVAKLRREKIDENVKKQQQEQVAQEMSEAVQQPVITASQQTPTQQMRSASTLDENFRNLLKLIIRSGEMPLYQQEDGSSISVGQYIIDQLQTDNIEPPLLIYKQIMDEFLAHCNEPGFSAENYFKFHTDPAISAFAVDLIVKKYQLSSLFEQQADKLPELVTQLLMELKYTLVNQRLDELNDLIKKAEADGDWEMMRNLLATQPQLLEIKNQLCHQLGNRIITL